MTTRTAKGTSFHNKNKVVSTTMFESRGSSSGDDDDFANGSLSASSSGMAASSSAKTNEKEQQEKHQRSRRMLFSSSSDRASVRNKDSPRKQKDRIHDLYSEGAGNKHRNDRQSAVNGSWDGVGRREPLLADANNEPVSSSFSVVEGSLSSRPRRSPAAPGTTKMTKKVSVDNHRSSDNGSRRYSPRRIMPKDGIGSPRDESPGPGNDARRPNSSGRIKKSPGRHRPKPKPKLKPVRRSNPDEGRITPVQSESSSEPTLTAPPAQQAKVVRGDVDVGAGGIGGSSSMMDMLVGSWDKTFGYRSSSPRHPKHTLSTDPIMAARSIEAGGEATTDYIRVRGDGASKRNGEKSSLKDQADLEIPVSPNTAASISIARGGYRRNGKHQKNIEIIDDTVVASKIPSSDGFSGGIQQTWQMIQDNKKIAWGILLALILTAILGSMISNRNGFGSNMSDIVDKATVDWNLEMNVAFIGGSYFFVNDIPRLMESISYGNIHQESVIHSSSGSIPDLLLRGNGMYYSWRTDNALLEQDYYYGDNGDEVATIYDFGLCTVAQILLGYDQILSYGNNDNAYVNDNKNPCIMDEAYYEYQTERLLMSNVSMKERWDYIVLADQTKRMALESDREESIYALKYGYGPLLKQTGAVPVLVDTHAFWSNQTNMTGLGGSVKAFQSLLYAGVQDYADALSSILPESQAPVIVPVGVAFLTIYEDNPTMWSKLFVKDQMHASVHGSYLFATVLYATLYRHLPDRTLTVNDHIEDLFADCRKLLLDNDEESYNANKYNKQNANYQYYAYNLNNVNGNEDGGEEEESSYSPYPTKSEAKYYRKVARRVVLQGYLPNVLKQ